MVSFFLIKIFYLFLILFVNKSNCLVILYDSFFRIKPTDLVFGVCFSLVLFRGSYSVSLALIFLNFFSLTHYKFLKKVENLKIIFNFFINFGNIFVKIQVLGLSKDWNIYLGYNFIISNFVFKILFCLLFSNLSQNSFKVCKRSSCPKDINSQFHTRFWVCKFFFNFHQELIPSKPWAILFKMIVRRPQQIPSSIGDIFHFRIDQKLIRKS